MLKVTRSSYNKHSFVARMQKVTRDSCKKNNS